jgi:type IV pilus assembly protein PilE
MRQKQTAGFTLIELMIVVAVMAIIVSVALPSYQSHVRKGKRAEGKAALLRGAQYEERFFSDNVRYATQAELAAAYGVTSGTTIYSGENPNTSTGTYTVTVALGAGNTSFTLTATPNAPHADTECGNLTLTSTGVRNQTGTAPLSTCW